MRRHGSEHGRKHRTLPGQRSAYTSPDKASRQQHPASLLTRVYTAKTSISVFIATLLMTSPYASHATSHGISLHLLLPPQSRPTKYTSIASSIRSYLHTFDMTRHLSVWLQKLPYADSNLTQFQCSLRYQSKHLMPTRKLFAFRNSVTGAQHPL
jgi:hypothetical protein